MPPAVQSASAPLGVASARDLGVLFARNAHRMVGQDGAFSIPLEPGRTLWFFGDTLIGRRPPAGQSLWTVDGRPVGPRDMTGRGTFERMINNTALVLRHRSGGEALDDFRYICDAAGHSSRWRVMSIPTATGSGASTASRSMARSGCHSSKCGCSKKGRSR
jgi:hypothetical protein